MRNSEIILSSSGLGAGKKGSELGTNALRIACSEKDYDLFRKQEVTELRSNHQLFATSSKFKGNYLEEILSFNEKVCQTVAKAFSQSEKVINITGDHSNAVGSISGLRKAFPKSDIGIIWIDAHADLHSPYSTPSFNIHGMQLAALCGLNNKDIGQAEPSNDQKEFWTKLKAIGGAEISPKISPTDIVFIDIRDLEKPEWDVIHKNDITHFVPEYISENGINAVVDETLKQMASKDIIYITFDVDSLDPGISRGTGTPVDNGLSKQQAIELLKAFYHHPKCKMLEVTEINPLLDKENAMAKAVADILQQAAI